VSDLVLQLLVLGGVALGGVAVVHGCADYGDDTAVRIQRATDYDDGLVGKRAQG